MTNTTTIARPGTPVPGTAPTTPAKPVPLPDPKAVAATLQRQAMEDAAGKIANLNPLPGALKEVWGKAPDIEVGPYKVGPFCTGHMIALERLHHPILVEGAKWEPVSPWGWVLCWMFTHPTKELREQLRNPKTDERGNETFPALFTVAEDEFADLDFAQLGQLMLAVMKQWERAMATMQGYTAASTQTEGEQSSPPASASPSGAS